MSGRRSSRRCGGAVAEPDQAPDEPDAGIIIDEHLVGIWFCVVSEASDFMAGLREITPDAEYQLDYRFRYYSPESTDPWDGKDEKHWFGGRLKTNRNDALAGMRKVTKALLEAVGSSGELWEAVNDGDFDKFMAAFMVAPWAHFKEMPQP
jgi:hypothetical protein